VLVPKHAPWLNDFLAEHAAFTGVNDKRDDFIDAAVAAFDELDNESDAKIGTKPRKLPGKEYLRDMDL
jgi:phage terminase large subunit-like protein